MNYPLNEAFVETSFAPYFIFHLKRHLTIVFILLLALAAEFFLLRGSVTAILLSNIIFLRALSSLLEGVWGKSWKPASVKSERYWEKGEVSRLIINASLACIAGVIAFTFFYFQYPGLESWEKIIFGLYLCGFFLQISLSYLFKAYGDRLTNRPLSSLLIGKGILCVVLFPALWALFGAVGLPLAYIAGLFVDGGVEVYLLKKKQKDIFRKKIALMKLWQDPSDAYVETGKWQLAWLFFSLEWLLFLVFFYKLYPHSELTFACFILAQLYWANRQNILGFYDDLKRVFHSHDGFLFRGFVMKFYQVMLMISSLFAILAMISVAFLYPIPVLLIAVPLVFFFGCATILSVLQIKALVMGRKALIVVVALTAIILVWISSHLFINGGILLLTLLPAILIAVMVSLRCFFPTVKNFLEPASIYELRRSSVPGGEQNVMHVISIYKGVSLETIEGFLSRLKGSLDASTLLCQLHSHVIVVFEPEGKSILTQELLSEISAGIIEKYDRQTVKNYEACFEGIQKEIDRQLHSNAFLSELGNDVDSAAFVEKMDRMFREYFPFGLVVDVSKDESLPVSLNMLERVEILESLDQFFRVPLTFFKGQQYYASLLYRSGVARLYLISKAKHSIPLIYQWNQMIHHLNFQK